MKPIPYCVPEALDMVLATARLVSEDDFIHRKVLTTVMGKLLEGGDLGQNSAALSYQCLADAYKALGVKDPYEKEKARRIKSMSGLEKGLREFLDVAPNRLQACLNLVLAGSLHDLHVLGREDMERALFEGLDAEPAVDDREALAKALTRAESVLYILGSAGEIVLDRILIEEIATKSKVTVVVAAKPVLDVATAKEAEKAGLSAVAEVIDPGTPMLGMLLERASAGFREVFDGADVVIAKGEVNCQTLANAPREVYCMLRATCPTVAETFGVPSGAIALLRVDGRNEIRLSTTVEP